MPIRFDNARWDRVAENYARWWDGDLGRPLIHMSVEGFESGRGSAKHPRHKFASQYGLDIPAKDVIDSWDAYLCTRKFLGDSFPCQWLNFGAGVVAAFLGADLEVRNESTWFHPRELKELSDISFQYDSDNVWLNRIKDLAAEAMNRWRGDVQIGMTDLGGILDILSTFRPSEHLLLDTCLYPDEIKRITWEIHDAWWKYFNEIDAILRSGNRGYTAWTPIFSEEPYYMHQCDFAYMIGPDMFDELVKPELAASCKKLKNAFYHLDGVGQLAHLDSLLEIEELKGIQWVPGAGQPNCTNWEDVHRKIIDAGKRLQITNLTIETFDTCLEQLGGGEGVYGLLWCNADQEHKAQELVDKYCPKKVQVPVG